jgi:hypothetical protein
MALVTSAIVTWGRGAKLQTNAPESVDRSLFQRIALAFFIMILSGLPTKFRFAK